METSLNVNVFKGIVITFPYVTRKQNSWLEQLIKTSCYFVLNQNQTQNPNKTENAGFAY